MALLSACHRRRLFCKQDDVIITKCLIKGSDRAGELDTAAALKVCKGRSTASLNSLNDAHDTALEALESLPARLAGLLPPQGPHVKPGGQAAEEKHMDAVYQSYVTSIEDGMNMVNLRIAEACLGQALWRPLRNGESRPDLVEQAYNYANECGVWSEVAQQLRSLAAPLVSQAQAAATAAAKAAAKAPATAQDNSDKTGKDAKLA